MEDFNKLKEHIKALAKEIMQEMNVGGEGEVVNKKNKFCEDIDIDPLSSMDEAGRGRPKGSGGKPKVHNPNVQGGTGGGQGGGRIYIPPTTILPGIVVNPESGFKIMSNGKTVNLFISPLGITALNSMQRGRTSFADEEKLSRLTRLYKDKIPTMTRVVIKKGLQGVRINNQPWIPVGVEIDDVDVETRDVIIKVPKSAEETDDAKLQNPLYERLDLALEDKLLTEASYNKFRNEIKFRTKSEQLHKAIREVNRKLTEIDRIVEYTSRMKQELSEGEDGLKYWKATQNAVGKIQETITQLSNKIRNLNQ
jgi:hypothetical protein